jgi:hypothetical protein
VPDTLDPEQPGKADDLPTIGQQVRALARVGGIEEDKDWHLAHLVIFGRGLTEADDYAVALAKHAFQSKITGWNFNAEVNADQYAGGYSYELELPPSELKKRMVEISKFGLEAGDKLKAHWGDLPDLFDAEDLLSRTLPKDWDMTIPTISGESIPETRIDRGTLNMLARKGGANETFRSSLLLPMNDKAEKVAVATADLFSPRDNPEGPPIMLNEEWLTRTRALTRIGHGRPAPSRGPGPEGRIQLPAIRR